MLKQILFIHSPKNKPKCAKIGDNLFFLGPALYHFRPKKEDPALNKRRAGHSTQSQLIRALDTFQ